MEETNTNAHKSEIIFPATEVKVLKCIAGKWVMVIHRVEKPGTFKHKPFFQN